MPRKMRRPIPKLGSDGFWHAWVAVGTKPNGQPDRRHIRRADENEVEDEIDKLLDLLKKGATPAAGRKPTVTEWMTTYLDTVAPRRCKPNTIADYRSLLKQWITPHIGGTRIDRLMPSQLDELYNVMSAAGRSESSALKVHRVLSRALTIAMRRELTPRNVTTLVDAPSAASVEVKPLTANDARQLVKHTRDERNGARWSVALALGLRQGEALGLQWKNLDLETGEMRVWRQLQRRTYGHGCAGTCGRKRGADCPDAFVPLASGDTTVKGGLVFTTPKGKSRRVIPVPDVLIADLKRHRKRQQADAKRAANVWTDNDLVFSDLLGRPLDPRTDYDEWRALLETVGVNQATVHDMRHTAATLLLAQGVDVATVQEILGHSDIRTTRGYVHVASAMAKAATESMGRALWE